MASLTFKQYLSSVNEDVSAEIAKLQSDISMIDAQIQQRTQPLVQRKTQLNKMLALKMQQQQNDQQKNPQQNTDGSTTQQAPTGQPGSMTAAPGSSGQQTPGNGGASL